MTYTVIFQPAAAREFRKLPPDIQKRMRPKIDALSKNPRPPGVEKLAGSEDSYRLRVGDYRVLYRIKDNLLIVALVRIAHRREVYRNIP